MNLMEAPQKNLRRDRGFITVDFLFSITVCVVLIMMMFAFSTTLSMIEVAQYVAYSTTRAHAAGAETQQRQIDLGTAKFNSFLNPKLHPALVPLLTNGWFTIDAKSLDIRGGGSTANATQSAGTTFDQYKNQSDDRMPQEGIIFKFHAPILKMNIPFLGSISGADNDDFATVVTGLMIREPTTEECQRQLNFQNRGNAILQLDPRFNSVYSANGVAPASAYITMEDNGC